MQQKLDEYIIDNHELHNEDLVSDKCLALLVELGELANETRCFKFWSKKPASDRSIILEEYVDGVHFILSIGLELGYTYEKESLERPDSSLTEQFNHVFHSITTLMTNKEKDHYTNVFRAFLQLGELLGFNESDIQEAYYEKNKVNFTRQNEGY